MFPWRIRLRHNITARYIRFLIKDWVSRPIPQLELYGCEGEYKFDWLSKLLCFRCWCSVAWSLVTIVVFLKKPPFLQSIECFHMAAMLVSQTKPLGIELYFYAKTFFCFSKPIWPVVT